MKHLLYLSCVALLLTAVSCSTSEKKNGKFTELVSPLYDSSLKPFYHGVASGDPLADRVIIWTRVTPEDSVGRIAVTWEVAETPEFTSIYKSDTLSTTPARDYTVKVDVDALKPGRTYYYRFNALGKTSMIGRTKTTPVDGRDSLKFAVVSCANWEWGYFNPYEKISERPDVDAVLHLGDYLYEYATGKYGDTTIRQNLPRHEIVSLSDYRTRHSQYRLDRGLRMMTQQIPLIAIWDDHEVANNSYTQGAQNHQADQEGDYQQRKAAARQAYYEWIPIRESGKHYRSFSFGPLADLIMLDERLEGKTKPVDSLSDPAFNSEDRSMLGSEQLNWFETNLKNSKATWKVIGNQVMFADIELSPVYPKMPRNLDSWDGYPAEKTKVRNFIVDNKLKDLVFLTGDTHASWAIEAATDVKKTYNAKTSAGAFAVEFGTTSVSSANDDEYKPADTVRRMEQLLLAKNPHIKYINDRDHGYLLLSLYPTKAKAEWYFVETVRQPGANEFKGVGYTIEKGSVKLK
ncbi:MAG: alkaline phosphatase D family protein [Bacteroidota bacterium]